MSGRLPRQMAPWVFIRDRDDRIVGSLPYRELTFVRRYNAVGTWLVKGTVTGRRALQLAQDGAGVVIQRAGRTLMSGPMVEPTIEESTSRLSTFSIAGCDDLDILDGSMALPMPSAAISGQLVDVDSRSGQASTVITGFVSDNVGPTARADRRLLQVSADPALGLPVAAEARFDNLMTLVATLAEAGQVGVRAMGGLNSPVWFSTYRPVDRSGTVRFSTALGNASSVTWSKKRPLYTDLVGGGQGLQEDRYLVESSNPAARALWGRREGFYDYRSADSEQLQSDTDVKLLESGESVSVKVVPLDTGRVQYGRHYGLGDVLRAEYVDADGPAAVKAVCREVEETWTRSNGGVVQPLLGDYRTSSATRNTLQQREWERRLSRLERGT